MGYSPPEVDQMSLWQFMSAVDGYVKANNPESAKELTADEEADLWAWMETKH